jgi:hypothetical protein
LLPGAIERLDGSTVIRPTEEDSVRSVAEVIAGVSTQDAAAIAMAAMSIAPTLRGKDMSMTPGSGVPFGSPTSVASNADAVASWLCVTGFHRFCPCRSGDISPCDHAVKGGSRVPSRRAKNMRVSTLTDACSDAK